MAAVRLAVLGYEAIVWGMSSGVIYHFDVACTFYVSLCSLATFWHDSLDMDRAMYRKAVVMLQLVAGLLSMFSLAYGLVMLVNDYSWEPMRKYVCCSNETAALMHSWPFERRTWHATAVRAGGPSAAACSACTIARADAAAKCIADLKALGKDKWLETSTSACQYKDDYLNCITKDSAGCCTLQVQAEFQRWSDDIGTMLTQCDEWRTCNSCTTATPVVVTPKAEEEGHNENTKNAETPDDEKYLKLERCTNECEPWRDHVRHAVDIGVEQDECWGGGHVYNRYDPLHATMVPLTCKDPAVVLFTTGEVSHAEMQAQMNWDWGCVVVRFIGVMVYWAALIVSWRESKAERGLVSEEEGGLQTSAPAAEDSSQRGAPAAESELLLQQLREAAKSAGLGQVSIAEAGAEDGQKFNSDELVMGMADDAGRGIGPFLNYGQGEPGLYRQVSIGMPAIQEEIELHGTEVDQECFDYVAYQEAGSSDKKFQNGWMRDRDPATGKVYPEREILDPAAPGGKRGMRLADFHAHEVSRLCQLTLEEVFVLRFYSTAGFRSINNPLRDQGRHRRGEAHGLAVLVFILSSAIKKLRAWAGTGDNKLKSQNLFRGMSNRKVFETFMQDGGTELAPMSTTSELWVALKYSQGGETATILWLRSSNFMDTGVDLAWISAYPHEQEFLYPALTYLKPINKEPLICVVGNVRYQIVEVAPQM